MNPEKSSGRLNPMHRHNTSGLFSGKGPPIFHDFPGEAQGGGPGEPKAIQRGPREPKRAPGEPKGNQKELQRGPKGPNRDENYIN